MKLNQLEPTLSSNITIAAATVVNIASPFCGHIIPSILVRPTIDYAATLMESVDEHYSTI